MMKPEEILEFLAAWSSETWTPLPRGVSVSHLFHSDNDPAWREIVADARAFESLKGVLGDMIDALCVRDWANAMTEYEWGLLPKLLNALADALESEEKGAPHG